MSQNRPPPAFQEFAANMMAKREYRLMTLAQRGLLYTMRLECWVNHVLPADPSNLAKYLGLSPSEVEQLLPAVMPFLDEKDGSLFCPELESYRTYLTERSSKQSEGGRKGAETKKRRSKSSTVSDSIQNHSTDHQGASKYPARYPLDTYKAPASNLQVLSLDQCSSGQVSSPSPEGGNFLEEGIPPDDDYFPSANDYDRASNGG